MELRSRLQPENLPARVPFNFHSRHRDLVVFARGGSRLKVPLLLSSRDLHQFVALRQFPSSCSDIGGTCTEEKEVHFEQVKWTHQHPTHFPFALGGAT
ncbi:hypothetical protein DMENIID0001_002420 [Sergentomyia squamirostris]